MKDLEQEVLGIGACDLPTIKKYQPMSNYEAIKHLWVDYCEMKYGYTKREEE